MKSRLNCDVIFGAEASRPQRLSCLLLPHYNVLPSLFGGSHS
jgi:hypothetical protein